MRTTGGEREDMSRGEQAPQGVRLSLADTIAQKRHERALVKAQLRDKKARAQELTKTPIDHTSSVRRLVGRGPVGALYRILRGKKINTDLKVLSRQLGNLDEEIQALRQ